MGERTRSCRKEEIPVSCEVEYVAGRASDLSSVLARKYVLDVNALLQSTKHILSELWILPNVLTCLCF